MKRLFLILLILIGSFFSIAGDKYYCEKESNYLECNDGNVYNGYYWHNMWVPGYPTQETHMLKNPILVTGRAVFYGEGAMEATARYRGLDLDKYVDGVSLLTCGDIGKPVWLKRPNEKWEGPFLVVDCAKRGDLWGIINYRNEAVEVGFETAKKWNMVEPKDSSRGLFTVNKWFIPNVKVSKVPPELTTGIQKEIMKHWFNSVAKFSTEPDKCKLRYIPPEETGELPTWRINCEWQKLYDNFVEYKIRNLHDVVQ